MKKYTATTTTYVVVTGDTPQEKADTYAWLKDAVQAAYGAIHAVTSVDADQVVKWEYSWSGEQP